MSHHMLSTLFSAVHGSTYEQENQNEMWTHNVGQRLKKNRLSLDFFFRSFSYTHILCCIGAFYIVIIIILWVWHSAPVRAKNFSANANVCILSIQWIALIVARWYFDVMFCIDIRHSCRIASAVAAVAFFLFVDS